MLSTPDPIPMSITPAVIFEAIIPQASSPEEHSLLIDTIGVVSGMPARKAPILEGIYPAPVWRLFPTAMS